MSTPSSRTWSNWTAVIAASVAFDAIWTACCAYVALEVSSIGSLTPYMTLIHPLAWSLVWLACAWDGHLYCRHVMGRPVSVRRALMNTGIRCLIAIWVVEYTLSTGIPPFLDMVITMIALTGCSAAHVAIASLITRDSRHRRFPRTAMVMGTADSIRDSIRLITTNPAYGYAPVRVCIIRMTGADTIDGSPGAPSDDAFAAGQPTVTVDAIRQADYRPDYDIVVLSPDLEPTNPDIQELLIRLETRGLSIVCLSTSAIFANHISMTDNAAVDGRLTLGLPQYEPIRQAGKRMFDIVIASICLVPATLIIGVTGIFIRHEDHGPILFRQERIGLRGHPFGMYKLRSMRTDAEIPKPELQRQAPTMTNEALFKLKDDPRLTRTGRIIRRLSIDELPQLWNVLKGDMSIVGPRPPLRSEFESYDDRYALRMLVKPGLTGLWQVSGRSDLDFATSVALDVAYVQNHSITGDFRILIRTIWSVANGKGAY